MNNYQICEYINSEDIRAYLREQNYEFTPVQCAFLVWQSQRHSIEQKHAAWNDIINTLPDCVVEKRMNCVGWGSLHQMLRDYMALDNKYLAAFEATEHNAVYFYENYEYAWHMWGVKRGRKFIWTGGEIPFHTLEDCYSAAKKYALEQNCPFRITKKYIGVPEVSYIQVNYDSQGNALEWDAVRWDYFLPMTEQEDDLWCYSFDGMWFDFPIPFERGDLVCDCMEKEPIVLMGTSPWYWQKRPNKENTHSDYSDMDACGYAYDREDKFLYDDERIEYLNMEHYREPIQGEERILIAYSQFEKGQIDAYTLLKLFHMIYAEGAARKESKNLKCYLAKDVWEPYTSEEAEHGKSENR